MNSSIISPAKPGMFHDRHRNGGGKAPRSPAFGVCFPRLLTFSRNHIYFIRTKQKSRRVADMSGEATMEAKRHEIS